MSNFASLFNLSDGDFGRLLEFGGSALNFGGTALGNRSTGSNLDANADIARLNAQEIASIVPLQIEALESDIQSLRDAADIREREIVEGERRAERQFQLGSQTFQADLEFSLLSQNEVNFRADVNEQLLAGTLDLITARADERIRELELQRRDNVAEIRSFAAGAGVRVGSGSTEAVVEDEERDISAQKGIVALEAVISGAQSVRQNELDQSSFRERLGAIERQITDIELEEQQLSALFEDALFDAGIEREINERNRDIAISRAEFEKTFLQRQGEIGIASSLARAEALKEGSGAATLSTLLATGGLGLDALQAFPTLGNTVATALGIGITNVTITPLPVGATLAPQQVLNTIGVTIGDLPAGANLTAGSDAASTITNIFSDFQAGLELGLSPNAALAGTAANFTQFLGQIALPVAAILAIPTVAKLITGSDNDVQAIGQATSKATQLLFSGNNPERAKALLGQPNNFSDPNPRTIADLQTVVNAVENQGGVNNLPPASRAIYEKARVALDSQIRERKIQSLGVGEANIVANSALSNAELDRLIDLRNSGP